MKNLKKIILTVFLFSSCHHAIKKQETAQESIVCGKDEVLVCQKIKPPEARLIKVNEKDYPLFSKEWDEDIKRAFDLNINYLTNSLDKNISYNFPDKKVTPKILLESTQKLMEIYQNSKDDEDLNTKIKESFDIYELKKGTNPVIFSSYYEPVFEASLSSDEIYKYPLYRKPDDMIEINLEDFDADKYKGQKLTGRLLGTKIIPYYTREEIDFDKVLSGKNYEIAYMKDIADVLDIHTQGSGILKLKEGGYKRAKFAATNSLKFKGWMTALIEGGYIQRYGGVGEDKTFYDRAKKFINEKPDLQRPIISQNKRYTFFYLDDMKSFDEGPIGTYGLNLVAQRSIAIDNSIIPLGMPAVVNLKLPVFDDNLNINSFKQSQRLVFCHDTGGAIKGARVDFFAGTGDKAKKFAYSIWEPGNLYLLILKDSK
ncbi:MAG: MltA domain-containing protein [Elusimicrobiota bacterium]